MNRLVTISYTGLNAGGGVPKFNRDLHSAFPDRECVHFCWEDYPWALEVDDQGETEWGRARRLNEYLVRSRKVTSGDVVIADGFWAAGLEHLPLAISHSHGIWSHLTHEDVLAGKQPDMPYHHLAQVEFRRRWTKLGKIMTAVSDFISEEMRLQWGFECHYVISNGVDTDLFRPTRYHGYRERPIIVHGVNDRTNANKGWNHIQHLIDQDLNAEIFSLDELVEKYQDTKSWALAQADIAVHPSGFEGNSMFVAEVLSCGIPIVAYEVGALHSIENDDVGIVIPRNERSPERTLSAVRELLDIRANDPDAFMDSVLGAREFAGRRLSLENFRKQWRFFIEFVEDRKGVLPT